MKMVEVRSPTKSGRLLSRLTPSTPKAPGATPLSPWYALQKQCAVAAFDKQGQRVVCGGHASVDIVNALSGPLAKRIPLRGGSWFVNLILVDFEPEGPAGLRKPDCNPNRRKEALRVVDISASGRRSVGAMRLPSRPTWPVTSLASVRVWPARLAAMFGSSLQLWDNATLERSLTGAKSTWPSLASFVETQIRWALT